MIWSLSLSIIFANSSSAPAFVLGASYTSMFAPGAIAETSSTSRIASPEPGPCGWPPSTGIVLRRPAIWLAAVSPK